MTQMPGEVRSRETKILLGNEATSHLRSEKIGSYALGLLGGTVGGLGVEALTEGRYRDGTVALFFGVAGLLGSYGTERISRVARRSEELATVLRSWMDDAEASGREAPAVDKTA